MSYRAIVLKRSCPVVFFLGLIAVSAAFGQLPTSPIKFVNVDAITTSFVATPTITANMPAESSGEAKQWLKVEFHYGTTDVVTADRPWVDAVEFKIWIEGLDQYAKNSTQANGKGVAVALTGSVTYVNIAAGKDIYGVFYVHPSTLARYSKRDYTDFDQKFNIHIEAYVDGTMVDYFDKHKDPQGLDWYKALQPVPNLVCRQDQCLFLVADPDRYPAIKLPSAAQ